MGTHEGKVLLIDTVSQNKITKRDINFEKLVLNFEKSVLRFTP